MEVAQVCETNYGENRADNGQFSFGDIQDDGVPLRTLCPLDSNQKFQLLLQVQ